MARGHWGKSVRRLAFLERWSANMRPARWWRWSTLQRWNICEVTFHKEPIEWHYFLDVSIGRQFRSVLIVVIIQRNSFLPWRWKKVPHHCSCISSLQVRLVLEDRNDHRHGSLLVHSHKQFKSSPVDDLTERMFSAFSIWHDQSVSVLWQNWWGMPVMMLRMDALLVNGGLWWSR